MERRVKQKITGYPTTDGAGVQLTRVLGQQTAGPYNPFLVLDAFDSQDYETYRAGFPMHPHRGIETITYVAEGAILHRDSLGHEAWARAGEVQWLTAGSGILHEELLPDRDGLLGIQLWLNMPAAKKMSTPDYRTVRQDTIPVFPLEGGELLLLAGRYAGHNGYISRHQPLDLYDIRLEAGAELTLETAPGQTVVLFTLRGQAEIAGERIKEKTAVLTTPGRSVTLVGLAQGSHILYLASYRLDEPLAWGGPIVMNTRKELQQAFDELQTGDLAREAIDYRSSN